MADRQSKNSNNAPGRYYVDDSCIDCDMCRTSASAMFTRDDDLGQSVVFRQPETADDITLAEEALEACPTQSIGNDGL